MLIGTWVGARTPDLHFYSDYGAASSLAMPIVADVIKKVEADPELGSKYLTPFNLPEETYSFLECEPFRQRGIRGFFNRLFGLEPGNKESRDSTDEIEKEVKSFLERLFGKKK